MIRHEQDEPEMILFDLGGVLMDFAGLHRLAVLTGEEEGPALRASWLGSTWLPTFERGECDARTFAAGVVEEWGLDLSPGAFLEDFGRWSAGPFPGAVELVRALHGTIGTGCLSNTNPVHWQRHLDEWGLVPHLDRTFTSHELGMLKPDAAVFDRVVEALDIAPGRVLFLDDAQENVDAARAAGLRAERTLGMADVRAALHVALRADSPAGTALRALPA